MADREELDDQLEDDDIFDEYDEEDDDDENDELEQNDDDDDDPYKDLLERARKEASEELVKELTSEDTNSPVYKGLQKVISKKDREIEDLRQALAGVADRVNRGNLGTEESNATIEFLMETLKDALPSEDQEVLEERLKTFKKSRSEKTEMEQMKQALQYLIQNQQGRGNSQSNEDPYAEQRRQATEELRGIASDAGFDLDDERLNVGDENEPLLERIRKLRLSINAVKSDTDRFRNKKKPPRTRRDQESFGTPEPRTARDVLSRVSSELEKKMRKSM